MTPTVKAAQATTAAAPQSRDARQRAHPADIERKFYENALMASSQTSQQTC